MSDAKISELPQVTTVAGSDLVTTVRPGDASGTKNKRMTVADFFATGVSPVEHEIFTATAGQTSFTILGPTPANPTKVVYCVRNLIYYYGIDFTITGNTLTWLDTDYVMQNGDKSQIWYDFGSAGGGTIGFTARASAQILNVTGDNTTYIMVYDAVDFDSGAPDHGLITLYNPTNGTAIVPAGPYMVSTTLHLSGISSSHTELTVQPFSATQTPFAAKFNPIPLRYNISGGLGEITETFSMPLYMPSQQSHSLRIKVSDVGGTPAGKTVSVEASSYFSMYRYQ